MAGYECKKCGETASSKCVRQRSVFPNDQAATLLGNMIRVKAVRKGSVDERYRRECDSDRWTVTYTLEADYVQAQDENEAIEKSGVVEMLTEASKETLVRAFCDHRWTIMAGCECNFGCCKGPKVDE